MLASPATSSTAAQGNATKTHKYSRASSRKVSPTHWQVFGSSRLPWSGPRQGTLTLQPNLLSHPTSWPLLIGMAQTSGFRHRHGNRFSKPPFSLLPQYHPVLLRCFSRSEEHEVSEKRLSAGGPGVQTLPHHPPLFGVLEGAPLVRHVLHPSTHLLSTY